MDAEITIYEKANTLAQALPYIQKYSGKTVVIKYGGNAMVSESLTEAVLADIILLSLVGIKVILVHGGGPEITEMAVKTGLEPRFVNGLRYTDKDTIDIVQMVLAGKTNKNLVHKLQQLGGSAIGLCGLDGGIIMAKKIEAEEDLGFVGEITRINPKPIQDVLDKGYIPVLSTIAGADDGGECVYNINADTAAAEVATALGAEKLILLTDTRGIMRDISDNGTLIPVVRLDEVDGLIGSGIIINGMIPKVRCCAAAAAGGVNRTHIIDGRIPHSLLIEMLSDEGIGTMITK